MRQKKNKRKRGAWLAALLASVMFTTGTLPALASPGLVFEDPETGRDAERRYRASGSEALRTENPDEEQADKWPVYGKIGTAAYWKKESRARPASGSEAEEASPSEARFSMRAASSLGDLWDDWNGDFSFLNGQYGDGSEERPYEIRTKNHLMGLSQLAAMGMRIQPGEGDIPLIGSYDKSYFKLMANLDLGGMEWNPIGFYRDSSELSGEVQTPFYGHFDGNGKTISNFKLSRGTWSNVGFFGAARDASIEHLTLLPGKTVTGRTNTAILAGSAENTRIADCVVRGNIASAGVAGGIAGRIEGSAKSGSVIENCTAYVTISVNGGQELFAGGICGRAAGSSIVDCRVETGDNQSARIQGQGAAVGGIVGFQNDTDVYNSFVSGTVGGAGSRIVGGITGIYASGKLKAARFEGTIGQSGLGTAGCRGTFIGFREAGDYFRYGEDVAFLFADSEAKIAANVCGSGIPDDNAYTYGAHIGFSHRGDLFYTLVQGGVTRDITDIYYYEELEDAVLHIMDEDNGGAGKEELGYELDHIAPNDAGRPTRGYLVTVPQIDTVSNGANYYDVASLEVRGSGSYYRTIDKNRRGAIAAGRTVTVSTSARPTDGAKFQMEGVPVYSAGGREQKTDYVKGGEYTFTMPAAHTQVKAAYKKVAVKVAAVPSQYRISVVEERTGNRKDPVRTTRVMDQDGRLIATYINGLLEQGTQIQPISIGAVVDSNNDVEDSSVRWSVDDADLITLLPNPDADADGYTRQSASFQINLHSSFLSDTIRRLEKEQADKGYRYPIPDTIFGAGHQNGGVAILTASTRPAVSFEGRPCLANARINVTFQVKDQTYVANEGAALDKSLLSFTVTRRLDGNRKAPEETLLVTGPESLTASFTPDFFDRRDIRWSVDDPALLRVDGEGKSASVAAVKDAKWIRDIMAGDDGLHENDAFAVRNGSGVKTARVTVSGDDMLGNKQIASCEAQIRFVTEDRTKILAEGISLSPQEIRWKLVCKKTGLRSSPQISWSGNEPGKLTAQVLPKQAFNRRLSYKVSDDSLSVSDDGTVTVNTQAGWIKEADRSYPHKAEHRAVITATSEDGGFTASCEAVLEYEMTDQTYVRNHSSGGSSGSSSGGSSGGSTGSSSGGSSGSSSPGPSGGLSGNLAKGPAGQSGTGQDSSVGAFSSEAGAAVLPADAAAMAAGAAVGVWTIGEDGRWRFSAGGRTYQNEWAYIYNPYSGAGQEPFDWFWFDASGCMGVGWFTDRDGSRYYLWPVSDGTMGRMTTGWQWIQGEDGTWRRYYFHTVSDGTKGHMYRSGAVPDGSVVNENGEWVVDGAVQIKKGE